MSIENYLETAKCVELLLDLWLAIRTHAAIGV